MKTRAGTWIGVGLGIALANAAYAADIPLVGLDDDGRPIEVKIKGKDYTEQMEAVMATVSDSVLPALASRGAARAWALKTVVVGIGVGFEVGLGPIIKLKATPRFRLAFAKDVDVVLP
jgi:hypothetical protein